MQSRRLHRVEAETRSKLRLVDMFLACNQRNDALEGFSARNGLWETEE